VAELSIGDDGSVRLRARAGESLPPPFEAAIGRDPWQPVPLEPQSIPGGGVRIDHEGPRGAASVELDLGPFALRVIGRRGEVVARLDGLAFEPGGGGCIACEARPGERFFGFGEKRGSLDKRGTRLAMRNRDPELRGRDPLYVSIPFFLALLQDRREPRACGVLLDAFGPSHFDVAASHAERVRMETRFDGIDVTIFPGPSPADVMRRFSARVGRTPLPPRWALGHHQSRWSYASEAEVRRVAREIRARRIPGDAIWLDIDHMDGYRVFTWHPSRFPAPQPLISDLD
jgi:alpha-glucosidase